MRWVEWEGWGTRYVIRYTGYGVRYNVDSKSRECDGWSIDESRGVGYIYSILTIASIDHSTSSLSFLVITRTRGRGAV